MSIRIKRLVPIPAHLLLSNGFPSGMAKTKVIEAGNVSDTILKQAEQGKFVAVALGRTGAGEGPLERIFMCSVSNTLFMN